MLFAVDSPKAGMSGREGAVEKTWFVAGEMHLAWYYRLGRAWNVQPVPGKTDLKEFVKGISS